MMTAKKHMTWYIISLIVVLFGLVIIAILEPMKTWIEYCKTHYIRDLPRNYAEGLVIAPFFFLCWAGLSRVAKIIPVRCDNSQCTGKAFLADEWRGIYECNTCKVRFPAMVMKTW
jgi:hypothetical protein